MTEMRDLFKRQAEWQAARRLLTWPEKVRIAEAMRATLLEFRRQRLARLPPQDGEQPPTKSAPDPSPTDR